MSEIYLGALSGTSINSVDVIAVKINGNTINVIDFISSPITSDIAECIRSIQKGKQSLHTLGRLDNQLGYVFASTVKKLLKRNLITDQIVALGLHGQTVIHHPHPPFPFTMQIGDPNIVANETGLVTVADFRRADMACGGQGAPLTPAFHKFVFGKKLNNIAIINIGGISNMTVLGNNGEVTTGFDVGPGNCLMDAWVRLHKNLPFDFGGHWARSQKPDSKLLQQLLNDSYFKEATPKSACTSMFDIEWLSKYLPETYDPGVIQSTLAELTVTCIAENIKAFAPRTEMILVCGGGAHNQHIMDRLKLLTGLTVDPTTVEGIDPLHVEAMTFAWLAHCRLTKTETYLPTVTGAKKASVLGAIYQPSE